MVLKAKVMDIKANIAGTITRVPKPICFILSAFVHFFRIEVSLLVHHMKKSATLISLIFTIKSI